MRGFSPVHEIGTSVTRADRENRFLPRMDFYPDVVRHGVCDATPRGANLNRTPAYRDRCGFADKVR